MRRAIVLALVVGLLGGSAAIPAQAKRKKSKPKPPITFEAEGTLVTANPADFQADAGITRNEFINTCSIPVSQGFDGYVIELSDEISTVMSNVLVSGSDATGIYDLDVYFYDESCAFTGAASNEETNQTGVMVAGSKYAVVSAFFGTNLTFTFEATEYRP